MCGHPTCMYVCICKGLVPGISHLSDQNRSIISRFGQMRAAGLSEPQTAFRKEEEGMKIEPRPICPKGQQTAGDACPHWPTPLELVCAGAGKWGVSPEGRL